MNLILPQYILLANNCSFSFKVLSNTMIWLLLTFHDLNLHLQLSTCKYQHSNNENNFMSMIFFSIYVPCLFNTWTRSRSHPLVALERVYEILTSHCLFFYHHIPIEPFRISFYNSLLFFWLCSFYLFVIYYYFSSFWKTRNFPN